MKDYDEVFLHKISSFLFIDRKVENRRFYQTVGKLGKIHHLKMKHNLCEHLFGRIDFSRNNF